MIYFSRYQMKNYRFTKRILWEILNAEGIRQHTLHNQKQPQQLINKQIT